MAWRFNSRCPTAAETKAAVAPGPLWEPRAMLVGIVSTAPARTAELLAGRFGAGVVQTLADGVPVIVADDARGASELMLIVGDADSWQRQYGLWQRVSRTGEVLVLAEAARELRTLAGVRELAPYATPFAGRAWTIDQEGRPSRVVLHGPPCA